MELDLSKAMAVIKCKPSPTNQVIPDMKTFKLLSLAAALAFVIGGNGSGSGTTNPPRDVNGIA